MLLRDVIEHLCPDLVVPRHRTAAIEGGGGTSTRLEISSLILAMFIMIHCMDQTFKHLRNTISIAQARVSDHLGTTPAQIRETHDVKLSSVL